MSAASWGSQRLVCVALYNFAASSSSELSLKQGKTVEVINKKDNGWWLGSCDGYSGVFPCTYVRELNSPKVVLDEAVAKAPIPGLHVSKGQRLLIVHRFDNGYFIVAPLGRLEVEIVHSALVQPIPRPSPTAAVPSSPAMLARGPQFQPVLGHPLSASMPVKRKPLPPPPGKAPGGLSASGGVKGSPHGHTKVLAKPLPVPTSAGLAPVSPVTKKALPKPPGRSAMERQDSLEASVLLEKRRLKELKKRDAAEKKEKKKRKKEREKLKKEELERKKAERELAQRNEELKMDHERSVQEERERLEKELLVLKRENAERTAAEQRAAEKARKEALALAQAGESDLEQLREADELWKETEEKWREKDELDEIAMAAEKKPKGKQKRGTMKFSPLKASLSGVAAAGDDGSSSDEEVLLQANTGGFMDDLASLTTL